MDQHSGPTEQRVTTNVGDWLDGLDAALADMLAHTSRVVSVAQFSDGRYVQFWVEPDGVVIAEVISNLYTGAEVALSEADEEQLRIMGWREPRRGPDPNWSMTARRRPEVAALVELCRRVVEEVLREPRRHVVDVHTWTIERGARTLDDLREESRVHYRTSLERLRLEIDGD